MLCWINSHTSTEVKHRWPGQYLYYRPLGTPGAADVGLDFDVAGRRVDSDEPRQSHGCGRMFYWCLYKEMCVSPIDKINCKWVTQYSVAPKGLGQGGKKIEQFLIIDRLMI